MKTLKTIIIFAILLSTRNIIGSETLLYDMADKFKNQIMTIKPGEYSLKIINLAPAAKYSKMSITIENHDYELLKLGNGIQFPGGEMFISADDNFSREAGCKLDSLYKKLLKIDSELEVKNLYSSLDLEATSCSSYDKKLFLIKFRNATTMMTKTFTVKKGQKIVLNIDDKSTEIENAEENTEENVTTNNNSPDTTTEENARTAIWETEKRGEWLTTYGLNIICPIISKEQHYFTSKAISDTAFTIQKENGYEKSDFSVSLFYTFMPNKPNSVIPAFTAGIGTDSDDLSLYLAGSLIVHKNVLINMGLAGHYSYELLGKYREGQTISENLDFSQLHEKQAVINPFIGISFRFDKNPISANK